MVPIGNVTQPVPSEQTPAGVATVAPISVSKPPPSSVQPLPVAMVTLITVYCKSLTVEYFDEWVAC